MAPDSDLQTRNTLACAAVVHLVRVMRSNGRGRSRHPESGPGGHAGMWIGRGARGGLDAPSKPIGRGCPPAREAGKGAEGVGAAWGLDIHTLHIDI
jgi:hypothetical protein